LIRSDVELELTVFDVELTVIDDQFHLTCLLVLMIKKIDLLRRNLQDVACVGVDNLDGSQQTEDGLRCPLFESVRTEIDEDVQLVG